MVNNQLHIIMPVKDSIAIAERAIRAIVDSGYTLCVYDDNSLPENAQRLDKIAAEKHTIFKYGENTEADCAGGDQSGLA